MKSVVCALVVGLVAASDDLGILSALQEEYETDLDFAEMMDALVEDSPVGVDPNIRRTLQEDYETDLDFAEMMDALMENPHVGTSVLPIVPRILRHTRPCLQPLTIPESAGNFGTVLPAKAGAMYLMHLARKGETAQEILDHLALNGFAIDENIRLFLNRLNGLSQIHAELFDSVVASIPRNTFYRSIEELRSVLRASIPPAFERHVIFFLIACLDKQTWENRFCGTPKMMKLLDGSFLSVYRIPQTRFVAILQHIASTFLLTPFQTLP